MNVAATTALTMSLAIVVISASGVPCQPGDVEDQDRGRCFLIFSDVTANWTAALDICQRVGATLAKMDEKDLNFLQQGHISLSKTYWFGMNDIAVENSFQWTDGTPVTWTHWRTAQPNNEGAGGQNCVCLDNNQEWQDKDCATNYYFICERVKSLNAAYVRYSSRTNRGILKQISESCLMDCVYRCEVTSSCFGTEFDPTRSQSNCRLYAIISSSTVTVSQPWLYFDKLA